MTVREDAPFSRLDIVNFLEAKGIETRPIEAGNMIDQPSMKGQKYRVVGDARNAKLIRKNSFFIGCHPGLTREDLEYVVNSFDEFFERTIKK
jgi:CDP-6-deoxy-D-xylo-4-hexulose-3-dehydrase